MNGNRATFPIECMADGILDQLREYQAEQPASFRSHLQGIDDESELYASGVEFGALNQLAQRPYVSGRVNDGAVVGYLESLMNAGVVEENVLNSI